MDGDREHDADLLERALGGDRAAMRALVALLTPAIQGRVGRLLATQGRARRNLRDEITDLTQDVFVHLFEADARVLRSWRPDRGASLRTFVAMIADRRAISTLRTRKRHPWSEDPSTDLDPLLPPTDGPEAALASFEIASKIVAELQAELSDLGRELFQRLVVDEQDVAEVVAETGMQRNAVYMWRSRLAKLVRTKAAVLMSDPRAPKRNQA